MRKLARISFRFIKQVTWTSLSDTSGIGAHDKKVARECVNDISCVLPANTGIVVNGKLQYIRQESLIDGRDCTRVTSAWGTSSS